MTALLAQKYDIAVPRYTSYPTAPHFNGEVDGARYREWLAMLTPGQPLSLYTHIPFCDEMCWFCGCYTKIVQRYEPIAEYLAVLQAEIALVAAALPGRFAVRHLHWGGGSPTLLRPADWHALVDHIRYHFDFRADTELAVELDPRDAREEYVAALAAAGVNRASIGVQDFDPDVQQAINRHQPYEVVARVCGWLRRYGIERINLDLMYGLPRQTVTRVLAMVDQALALGPDRVALFGYAHVPWMRAHQKLIDERELPDSVERWQQFTAAAARLQAAGMVAIGLDHFARPDDGLAIALAQHRLKRNFQGYTTDDAAALIGLGASSISALPAGYAQNASPLRDYARSVGSGELPTVRGIGLSEDDRMRREIIERLMCELVVDLAEVASRYGRGSETFAGEMAALAPLAGDGIVELSHDRIIRVPEGGRAFVRLAAAAFDSYLARGQGRHSRAV
jgi:oxygen-independent coproporphyrinogen-3 oxidase